MLPFDESPPKKRVPTHTTGSMATSLGSFRQGVDLTTDGAMYSNFAKMHGNAADEAEQLNFGVTGYSLNSVLFNEADTIKTGLDYILYRHSMPHFTGAYPITGIGEFFFSPVSIAGVANMSFAGTTTYNVSALSMLVSGSVFAPTDIPGITLWLDANQGITDAGGGAVSGWADQSGNSYHVYQENAAGRPVISSSWKNGFPAVYFTGDELINSGTNILTAGAAATIFFVGESTNVNGGSFFTRRRTSTYQSAMFYLDTYLNGDGVGAANVNTPDGLSALITTPFYSTHKYLGTGVGNVSASLSGVDLNITVDGNGQTTETGNTGFIIGNNSAGQTWPGYIAEVIVYDSVLSAENISLIEAYLVGKYGF